MSQSDTKIITDYRICETIEVEEGMLYDWQPFGWPWSCPHYKDTIYQAMVKYEDSSE